MTNHFCDSGWRLQQSVFDSDAEACNATLFALANGVLGVRGGLDELRGQSNGMLAEAYARRPIEYHERFAGFADHTDTRFAAPSPAAIEILIDGKPHVFQTDDIVSFDRSLDLKTGILTRSTVWRLSPDRTLKIAVDRIVPLGAEALCVSVIRLTLAGSPCQITVSFPLEDTATSDADGVDDPRLNTDKGVSKFDCGAKDDGLRARFTAMPGVEAPDLMVNQSIVLQSGDAQVVGNRITAKLADGQSTSVNRLVAYGVGADAEAKASAILATASAGGYDKLVRRHKVALDAFWDQAAINIDGDGDMEGALRFSLFQLFQSASRSAVQSVAAKGLTGEGYEGHYFWDTETFVLPVLTLMQPELAHNIITYRISKLGHARRNAAALGHRRGALYPWRTISGNECSAHYPTGAAQYHINAAIACAVEEYQVATGDDELVEDAAEMLFETARIWMEIGHFSDRRHGAFVIHGVTGPDEYSALVDNDFYTNTMAARHLNFAARLAREFSEKYKSRYSDLCDKIGLGADEIAAWEKAADAMWLPIDPTLKVHPQDDSFLDKPDFPFVDLPKKQFPLLLHHHPLLLFRHRICKQGNVMQALAVAGDNAPLMQKSRDFDFYEPLTTHDSTLSASAFGIIAVEIGRHDQALAFHRETAFVDLEDLHANSAHGGHMAAMASSWLILAEGWGGMRIFGGELHFRPVCPAKWNGYNFRIQWRGSTIEVTIDDSGATYRLINGPPMRLYDHGRVVMLHDDATVIVGPTVIKAVIFDLDGVLTDTAEAHYLAWKRMSDDEGFPFSRSLNEKLKGINRAGSLAAILEAAGQERSDDERAEMMARKNGYYREAVAAFSPADLFPGARILLQSCLHAGLRIGLASASRNAGDVVRALGIEGLFDVITDAGEIKNGKPDPEIFLKTAETLDIPPENCVGIEDAFAGIVAIRAAGMPAIGIGEPSVLTNADQVFPDVQSLQIAHLLEAPSAGNLPNNNKAQC